MVQDLQQEVRRQNKITADWLLRIEERKAEYQEKRATLPRTDSGLVAIPPGKGGRDGDKTARAAVELADMDTYYRGWVNLVQDVERSLPHDKLILLRLRRQGLRFKDLQYHYSRELQVHLGNRVPYKSRDWFNRVWKEIVEVAARMAAERGLFKGGTFHVHP